MRPGAKQALPPMELRMATMVDAVVVPSRGLDHLAGGGGGGGGGHSHTHAAQRYGYVEPLSRSYCDMLPVNATVASVYNVNSRVVLARMTEVTALHRSVPPRADQERSIVEIYSARSMPSADAASLSRHLKLSPLHGGPLASPSDYASYKQKMRQPAKPKVIGLDSKAVLPQQSNKLASRGVAGFFPPTKLRAGNTDTYQTLYNSHRLKDIRQNISPTSLGLPPNSQPGSFPQHWHHNSAEHGPQSSPAGTQRCLPVQPPVNQTYMGTGAPVYPNIIDETFDDLSLVPRPRMKVSRDNPWVFRQKVKQNMNKLCRIMASRPASQSEFSSSSLTNSLT